MTDQIHTFTFDSARIRGRIVRLEPAWQTIRGRHAYPPASERALGDMLAIVAMLAHGIKLEGSVILQIRGDAHVGTAMAECVDRTRLRGIVRPVSSTAAHSGGGAQLAITLKPHVGSLYQGIVPVSAASIAQAVEAYFATSEQLPTRVWTAGSTEVVAGLLLQRLPDAHVAGREPEERADEDWQRLQRLASTVGERELLTAPADALLMRLFPGEAIRLHNPHPLTFGCSCSRQRTADALRIMGRSEVNDILEQEGRIDVTCEFCGERYAYDSIDAQLLFEPLAGSAPATPQ